MTIDFIDKSLNNEPVKLYQGQRPMVYVVIPSQAA